MSRAGRGQGGLAGLDGPGLVRVLRRGRDARRVAAARALAELDEPPAAQALRDVLADRVPGVRRAAARGLGRWGHGDDASRLSDALALEVCTTVAVDLAAAWVRCGGRPDLAGARLQERVGRRLRTARGPREPDAASALGARTAFREWWLVLAPDAPARDAAAVPTLPLQPRSDLLEALRRAVDREPDSAEGRQAVEALGAQGHPGDLGRLVRLRQQGGRRTDHAALSALGRLGDPAAVDALLGALVEMDVDPGRAFAHRRIAAVALGRLGLPSVAPRLHRALRREALEHEGRPGAGLGIQYPVRANLLWALGELQAPRSIKVLVPYLGDASGSALGGFHLPAMGALVKLGAGVVEPMRSVAEGGAGDAALNAVGVLEALATDHPTAHEALVALAVRPGDVGERAREALS